MKILVAATGGTIGSAAKDGVISTDKGQTLLLLELFRNAYGDLAEFQVETLCSVLSENADDAFYETLCGFLKTVNSRDCDGVILLHGTDTLSFSAARAKHRQSSKRAFFSSAVYSSALLPPHHSLNIFAPRSFAAPIYRNISSGLFSPILKYVP